MLDEHRFEPDVVTIAAATGGSPNIRGKAPVYLECSCLLIAIRDLSQIGDTRQVHEGILVPKNRLQAGREICSVQVAEMVTIRMTRREL
jgi:hypothetical protein